MALLAACLQFIPLIRVLLSPFYNRMDNPIPRLRIPSIIYQDTVYHHFDLIFQVLFISGHSGYLLILQVPTLGEGSRPYKPDPARPAPSGHLAVAQNPTQRPPLQLPAHMHPDSHKAHSSAAPQELSCPKENDMQLR